MALTGNGSKLEQGAIAERLKRIEDIIYNKKYHVKCGRCDGKGYEYFSEYGDVSAYKKSCSVCNGTGYLVF